MDVLHRCFFIVVVAFCQNIQLQLKYAYEYHFWKDGGRISPSHVYFPPFLLAALSPITRNIFNCSSLPFNSIASKASPKPTVDYEDSQGKFIKRGVCGVTGSFSFNFMFIFLLLVCMLIARTVPQIIVSAIRDVTERVNLERARQYAFFVGELLFKYLLPRRWLPLAYPPLPAHTPSA
ncbi:hypothetical protein AMATHDRAFT_70892 [Amanita thiersii Skay4041]|uniref:ABC transmembrane type-1 domain-containing protein n=1 Tax=Amanita thiersii Skay4041 TaxID=703135 RepID=A0A2A9NDS2_9AGAR|nr:hypothetical protein AMATHDRAFT_70892 [Amanita thiersii Skay4041]